MVGRVDQWIYTADKNLEVFDRFGRPKRLAKVENGYAAERAGSARSVIARASDPTASSFASPAGPSRAKVGATAVEAVERLNAAGRNVELS